MVLEIFKSIDIYSKKFAIIQHNGKTSHKTILGGILTFSTSLLLITIICFEVYNFINGKVSLQSKIIPFYMWDGTEIFDDNKNMYGYLSDSNKNGEITKKFLQYYRLVHTYRNKNISGIKKRIYELSEDELIPGVKNYKFEIPMKEIYKDYDFKNKGSLRNENLAVEFASCDQLSQWMSFGYIDNPEKLKDCNKNTEEFNDLMKKIDVKFTFQLVIPEYNIDINGEIKTSNNFYDIYYKYDPNQIYFYSLSSILFQVEYQQSKFYESFISKNYLNFEKLNREFKPDKSPDGTLLKIILFPEPSSYNIYYKITKPMLLDLLSKIGGLLKFFSYAKIFLLTYETYSLNKLYLNMAFEYKDAVRKGKKEFENVPEIPTMKKEKLSINNFKTDSNNLDLNNSLIYKKKDEDLRNLSFWKWIKIHFCCCLKKYSIKRERIKKMMELFEIKTFVKKMADINILKNMGKIDSIEKTKSIFKKNTIIDDCANH